jgi:hypothetical protein
MKYSRLDFLEPAFPALNKHFAHGLSRFKEKYAASHYDPSVYTQKKTGLPNNKMACSISSSDWHSTGPPGNSVRRFLGGTHERSTDSLIAVHKRILSGPPHKYISR